MRGFITKRKIVVGASVVAMLAAGIGAYAFFTTTGSGSGTGTVGSASNMTLNQVAQSYVDSTNASTTALLPGGTETVTLTVTNPATFHQELGTVSVSGITADSLHTDCNSTAHPTWFTTTTDAVNQSYAPGANQAVPGNIQITLVDVNENQDVCEGATLTIAYSA